MERTRIKIIALLLAASNLFAAPIMTRPGFYAIELGTPVDTVIKEHGEPFSIKANKDGSKDYLYVERIPVDEEMVQENRYTLVIKNGQVVSKRFNEENPPAYDEIYDDNPNNVPN